VIAPRVLLDSNIVIYGTDPGDTVVRRFVSARITYVSIVTVIETLGYRGITPPQEAATRLLLDSMGEFGVTDEVADLAIALRQSRKISLADSVIAATALVYTLPVATRNTKDFSWVGGLVLIDPYNP